jgi:CRP-like cAMP-binding protein
MAPESSLPNSASLPASNRLLDGLPAMQRRAFLAECKTVHLAFGQPLGSAGDPIRLVYFPLTAFISRVTPTDRHQPLEVGLVGNEGMLGETLWLGQARQPIQALVQGSGESLQMTTEQFYLQLDLAPALGPIVGRYVFVLIEQLAQNAACHAFHELRERLVRWLLMTHDRAGGDHLELTHLYLSDMLGVRRSAVTIAASDLQARKLIRYARGRIQILSRSGLEALACECYTASVQAYERQFSKSRPAGKH